MTRDAVAVADACSASPRTVHDQRSERDFLSAGRPATPGRLRWRTLHEEGMAITPPAPAPARVPGPVPRDAVAVFDIGGSHLRHARWTPAEGLHDRVETASPSFRRHPTDSVAELRARLVEAITGATPHGRPAVAGISLGAALDHRTGTVYASAPLWGDHVERFDMLEALRAHRPQVRWHLVNDVTAALLHFAAAPERRKHRRIMLATVSTGIACRILDRRGDRVPVDGSGLQGEIGHLPATAQLAGQPVDLPCDCGAPRHVAAFSSGPGIRRMADEMRRRTPKTWEDSRLHAAMENGASFETAFRAALDEDDATAHDLLTAVTGPVADVLRTALCLDPDLDEVALTGGVAVSLGQHYRTALTHHLRRQGLYLTGEFEPGWAPERITVCAPGAADGLVGAALAAARAEGML